MAAHARIVRPVLVGAAAGVAVGAVLWMLPLERPRGTLHGENGLLNVHWSPDSRQLIGVYVTGVGAANRGEFRVWDVATGRGGEPCEGGRPIYLRFAFSPDGTRMAGRDDEDRVAEFDRATLRVLARHRVEPFSMLAYAPDGRLLTTREMTARVVEVGTGKLVRDLSPDGPGADFSVEAAGRLFIHDRRGADVIDMTTGRRLGRFRLGGELAFVVQLSGPFVTPDARRLVYYADNAPAPPDRRWYWCDRETGECAELPPDTQLIAVSADAAWGVGGYFSREESWWRRWLHIPEPFGMAVVALPSGRTVARLPGATTPAAFAPDGRTLAVGREMTGAIELWDFPIRKRWNLILGGGLVAGAVVLLALTARRRAAAGRGRTGRIAVSPSAATAPGSDGTGPR
jgi:hypothetical protein